MKLIKTYKNESKHANINLQNETFIVEFFESNRRIGEVEYSDKTFRYVEDAADNWVSGVMTSDTIRQYSKTI
jgi:hypothetical protein|tara:strand:+ start:1615 stop:1830 length:216 start_codon:yes stop_codon:yes gene_type:complete